MKSDSKDFYRAFEERYRGPRELIASRLEVYLPFIGPLRDLYRPAAALDLGCGRGEWLELLAHESFEPQGVDLDEGMLEACRERGLPVNQGDAIQYLQSLADESQCVVSGFHIAEHIAFDELETLVIEALRVLKPGGLLILETPNPENLVVGTNDFWLDPTHQRPLPPPLLAFLPEHYGYRRVKTLRLQEAAELRDTRTKVALMQVLDGASSDYSVVAQKDAAPQVLARFDAAFVAPHGVTLEELANRHDAALELRLANAEARAIATSEALVRIAEQQNRQLETERQMNRQVLDALQQAHARETALLSARAAEAESHTHQLRQRIEELNDESSALHASWSWRVTAPLRWGAGLVLDTRADAAVTGRVRVSSSVATTAQRPLAAAMRIVLRRPALAYRINQRLLKYPQLHQWLAMMARREGLMPGMPSNSARAAAARQQHNGETSGLTRYGRELHVQLKAAINRQQQVGH